MKTSEIKFTITLDAQNVPDKITWDATDNPNEGLEESQAIAISVWDHFHKGTMKIDLWTKAMPVNDMKRFVIECIGGVSETLMTATGDEKMVIEMEDLCQRLSQHVEEQIRKEQQQG